MIKYIDSFDNEYTEQEINSLLRANKLLHVVEHVFHGNVVLNNGVELNLDGSDGTGYSGTDRYYSLDKVEYDEDGEMCGVLASWFIHSYDAK